MKTKLHLLTIGCVFLFKASIPGQFSERTVDSVCTVYALLYDFDGVILVANENRPIFEGAFGYTSAARNEHVSLDTRFSIGELTHMFTSVMVMKLVEDGDLYLDETVDIFFPKEKIPGKKFITIEHLLTFSSGLPNNIKVLETTTTEFHPQSYIASLNERRLESPPGEESVEKHIDYIILGLIIERIMGMPWDEALKELILDPCGMTQTGVVKSAERDPAMAASYHVVQRPLDIQEDIPVRLDNFFAAGAVYSTLRDMFLFDNALYENKLLSRSMMKLMFTKHPDFQNIAFGWRIDEQKLGKKKMTITSGDGHVQGYNALWMRFEEDKRTIMLLSNSNMVDLQDFASHIRRALYGDTISVTDQKGKNSKQYADGGVKQ